MCFLLNFSGALTWQANGQGHNADNFHTQARALHFIADRSDHGKIGVTIGGSPHPRINPNARPDDTRRGPSGPMGPMGPRV